jgi:Kdo2-lipid IVA lauroyltransferase/acyltransferase
VSVRHALEAMLVQGLVAAVRSVSWRRSLAIGVVLGDRMRDFGVRRRVATANLALAFPERSGAEREGVLREHYRELGRVAVEYARLGELARAEPGQVVGEVRGLEHLLATREAGRGAILLSGHFGHFELVGASLGRHHPVDFVVKPLSNHRVEALIARERAAAGVGSIPLGAGIRRVVEALRDNRWVAMLGDQDARRAGVFVPFFGRPASTPIGPARLALATGAPIVMGFVLRRPDGRHDLEIGSPLAVEDPRAPDAVERLTALHTARLEAMIRRRPESWFWLHRRWKTAPHAVAVAAIQPVVGAACGGGSSR